MPEIASHELRDNTADILRQVEAGERLTIMLGGRAVAELVPLERISRGWIPRADLVVRLRRLQADPGLRDDLRQLAGDTTDDLGLIC